MDPAKPTEPGFVGFAGTHLGLFQKNQPTKKDNTMSIRTKKMTSKSDGVMWIHLDDYRRSCQGQPLAFQGMCIRLLAAAWENGGKLPDDEKTLQQISGGTPRQWRKYREGLLRLFPDAWNKRELTGTYGTHGGAK